MSPSSGIRAPAVAGLFYPRDREGLARAVDALLAQAPAALEGGLIRTVVSPHAGYAYSGRVAARGFRLLATPAEAPAIRRVVVIGPSHVEAFSFTSVFDGRAYRTPLGDVPIDEDTARAIASSHASIRLSPRGHVQPHLSRGEHGIEVQVPFLQTVLPDASLVAIVMGSQDWDSCAALGEAIASACDPSSTLVVASSDLSHFYPYEEANRLDSIFCSTLEGLDAAALHGAVARSECEACGAGPVVASLIATELSRERRCRVLQRLNSGDVTGDRSSVVGYASAVVVAKEAA
jgi:AmmeMemoRadiSam system protein B